MQAHVSSRLGPLPFARLQELAATLAAKVKADDERERARRMALQEKKLKFRSDIEAQVGPAVGLVGAHWPMKPALVLHRAVYPRALHCPHQCSR